MTDTTEPAGQAVVTAARQVVLNAYGTHPKHTRARDGGCRDDCIPCGIKALEVALEKLDQSAPDETGKAAPTGEEN